MQTVQASEIRAKRENDGARPARRFLSGAALRQGTTRTVVYIN